MSHRSAKAEIAAPGVMRTRPVLVTGGAGFIGCNLVDRLVREGEDVLVLDNLSRPGVDENLAWLKRRHRRRVSTAITDVRDGLAADAVSDASGVFHLAAQVAVTTSLEDPGYDLDVNTMGTLNLLNALRRQKRAIPLVFASTNKVYGDLADIALERTPDAYRPCDEAIRRHGISEARPLSFHTPYGCSKGAADQYVIDYARTFGLPTAVLRMSCIYGPHQVGSEDQGWVAHFLMSARNRSPITIYGDGRQVRDILYIDDAVEAYVKALRHIGRISGSAFNLGGGSANAVSLLQVLARIKELFGSDLDISFSNWRPADQRYYVSDTRLITRALGLAEPRPWPDGIRLLAEWLGERHPSRRASAPLVSTGIAS